MKKDREWLKNEMLNLRNNNNRVMLVTIGEVMELIYQLDEPEKVVIPKFVADWIEKYIEYGYDLYPALKKMENNARAWKKTYYWYRKNTYKFVNAYLTGEYEVEEEPLYYAWVKGHELIDDEGDLTCKYWKLDTSSRDVSPSNQFSTQISLLTEMKMSKEDWANLGINDSNADFIKVVEVSE